jgi:hypothetical protein
MTSSKELSMKRILSSLALAALSIVIATTTVEGLAVAQQKGKAPPKGDTDKPAQQRVKNYDFDADVIDGELVKPEGEFLNARKFAEHGSLIRVRADFIREIVKSAEDL